MRRPPRTRIALNDEPLLKFQLQRLEARRVKRRCHEASEPVSCTHTRATAGMRNVGQRACRTALGTRDGHDVRSSPVHRMEASQVVRWELRKLLSCSRQPSQPRLALLLHAGSRR